MSLAQKVAIVNLRIATDSAEALGISRQHCADVILGDRLPDDRRSPKPERPRTGLDDWFDEKVMVDFENQEPLTVSEVVNSANAYLAEKGLRQVSSRALGMFLTGRVIVSKVARRAGKAVRVYPGVWAVLY